MATFLRANFFQTINAFIQIFFNIFFLQLYRTISVNLIVRQLIEIFSFARAIVRIRIRPFLVKPGEKCKFV